jgi:3-oxoacyl-[acyl-carrier-protein] synthase-3
MVRTAQIVSTARYLPEHAVTNAKLTARFTALGRPTVIDRLGASTGITQRFYAPDDWVTSDLALPAAREALNRAGRKPADVDLIIVGTTSPDYITPDTSVVVQNKLGAKNAGTFDVGSGCASFPSLIAIGAGLLATNSALKTILLIGVEMIHRLTDPNDPGCFLWSDGAGAVVLESGDEAGFIGAPFRPMARTHLVGALLPEALSNRLASRPWRLDALRCAGKAVIIRRPSTKITGHVLFKRLCAESSFTSGDVDQLLFTQISKPSIAIAAERCGVPAEKCHTIMEKYGYTGSACIPMALDDAIELGKIKRGDLVVMISSALGWHQAAVAIRMTI